jgi:hypothetical protein
VAVICDADECHDETIVQLYGGHVVRVLCTPDEVLAWFAWSRESGGNDEVVTNVWAGQTRNECL